MSELVLASSEAARDAHRELYHLAEGLYIIAEENLFERVASLSGDLNKLHIASNWADILKLATWRAKPAMADVFFLLTHLGIRPEELQPFRESGIEDLFPWLYYARRFDILRKVCLAAKTNAERHLTNRETRIYCHLTSAETNRIVASSL